MDKIKLNKTGLNVSRLCFGTGKISDLSEEEGGGLLKNAFKNGVNFWDTSDDYDTHRHVREGLRGLDRKKIVLMSKITRVFDKKKVKKHVQNMLKELKTDYLDIVLLHAVDSERELKKYLEIIGELKKCKINHIGISSHQPDIINKIVEDKNIEFILAPLNYKGWRIKGNYSKLSFGIRRRKMINVLKKCKANGKDIFAIKVLATGRIKNTQKAIKYCLKKDFIDGINLGITNEGELNEDIRIVNSF